MTSTDNLIPNPAWLLARFRTPGCGDQWRPCWYGWRDVARNAKSSKIKITPYSHKTKLTNSRRLLKWSNDIYNIYVYPNAITCNQTIKHSTHQYNIVKYRQYRITVIHFCHCISMCMHVHFKFECWRLFIRAAPALHWWRRWLPHGRQRRSLLFAVRTTSAAPWSHGRLLFVNGRSSGRSMDTQEVWLASRGWQVSLIRWCTF